MTLLTFASLAGLSGLVHGISTRALPRADVPEALGMPGQVLTATQVHGSTIVATEQGLDDPGRADGLSTNRPGGPLLGVLGADCPGVLLVAPAVGALAVLHAGWRGVAAGIVPAGIHLMTARYGASAEDMHVGIGPGISGPRYEVSDEVAEALAASVRPADRDDVLTPGRPGHAYADLRAALRAQLLQRGVPAGRIETSPVCTYDDERFYSYRRDGPTTGRHLLVAAWRG